jgi:hypothetical protein
MTRAHLVCVILLITCCPAAPPLLAADFQIGNSSSYSGNKRWDWTVYLTAPRQVLDRIKCVEYTLHPTFPDPIQVVCERGSDDNRAFPLSMNGWGEFEIGAKVTFSNGTSQTARHYLKLQQAPAALCRVIATRSVTEDEVWPLPDPFRPLHVYADELHRGRLALFVFSTRSRIDSRSFNWMEFKNRLRPGRDNQPLADETYVAVKASPDTLSKVQRSNGSLLQFFVSEPVRGSARISLCAN